MDVAAVLAVPPTSALPRWRREPDLGAIEQALDRLELVYAGRGWDALDAETQDRLEAARADATERDYVLRWLYQLVSDDALAWLEDTPARRAAIERGAVILAGCTSALEAGDLVRSFSFPLPHDDVPAACRGATPIPITMTVRDASLPPSDANSVQGAAQAADAVGVQTYASSVLLCDWFVRAPGAFYAGLARDAAPPVALRVMELGAGTGIVGMVVAAWLSRCDAVPQATVHITDYHADVLANLRHNVDEYLAQPRAGVEVRCEALDWRALYDLVHPAHATGERVASAVPPPQSVSLVLVADPVYGPEHAQWLMAAIVYLLAQPDTDPAARAHIVLPMRTAGRLAGLYETVDVALAAQRPRRGYVLTEVARTTAPTRAGLGRRDERGYIWTELAWTAAS